MIRYTLSYQVIRLETTGSMPSRCQLLASKEAHRSCSEYSRIFHAILCVPWWALLAQFYTIWFDFLRSIRASASATRRHQSANLLRKSTGLSFFKYVISLAVKTAWFSFGDRGLVLNGLTNLQIVGQRPGWIDVQLALISSLICSIGHRSVVLLGLLILNRIQPT